MKYVNYKKNELKHVQIADLKESLPDVKTVGKTQVIANWLMAWIDKALETQKFLMDICYLQKQNLPMH